MELEYEAAMALLSYELDVPYIPYDYNTAETRSFTINGIAAFGKKLPFTLVRRLFELISWVPSTMADINLVEIYGVMHAIKVPIPKLIVSQTINHRLLINIKQMLERKDMTVKIVRIYSHLPGRPISISISVQSMVFTLNISKIACINDFIRKVRAELTNDALVLTFATYPDYVKSPIMLALNGEPFWFPGALAPGMCKENCNYYDNTFHVQQNHTINNVIESGYCSRFSYISTFEL